MEEVLVARNLERRGRRNWLLLISLALSLVSLTALGLAFVEWSRPYPLPALPHHLTPEHAGLLFEQERVTVRALAVGARLPDMPGWDDFMKGWLRLHAGQFQAAFPYFVAALQRNPDNLMFGNALRRGLALHQQWGPLLTVWDTLDTTHRDIRLQKALAMVDAMADTSRADSWVGRLSMRSVAELDVLLNRNSYDWLARYARGLNNLYWPVTLRRIDKAVVDLGYCVSMIEALDLRDSWLALGYIAYGDAHPKAGRGKEVIAAWQTVVNRFANSLGLRRRFEAGPSGAMEIVRREL